MVRDLHDPHRVLLEWTRMGMSATVKLVPVQEAYDDLLNRTLSRISCDLGRLIYLASTRDYNTGNYYHEGLASRFSPEVARKALEMAHRQAFYKVSGFSLEGLASDLEAYLRSTRENPQEFLRTWQKLEPYRIAIPTEVNLTVARLFTSNLRLALAILRFRQEPSHSRR
jgi:hypothetical protein